MDTREQLLDALDKADQDGNDQEIADLLEMIRELDAESAPRSIGERVTGMAETGASVLSSALTEPFAGLSGLGYLATHMGEQDALTQAADVVSRVRSTAFRPTTEAGQEYLGNVGRALAPVGNALSAPGRFLGESAMTAGEGIGLPDRYSALAAALAETVPTALMSRLSMPKPQNTPGFLYDATGLPKPAPRARVEPTLADDAARSSDDASSVATPEQVQAVSRNVERRRTDASAYDVNPDPEVMAAAERQRIELNPSHYSRNPAYTEYEQALKSKLSNQLSAVERKAIDDIGRRADELVADLGGSADRAVFGLNLRETIDRTVTRIKTAETRLHNRVRAAISPRQTVDAANARAYIQRTIDDLGGDVERLTKPEKALLDLLDSDKPMTYAALDRLRRDIGDSFDGIKSPYADVNAKVLRDVYAALSDDQMVVADAAGVGEVLRRANELSQKRFSVQDTSVELFGRALEGSVLPRVRAAATKLADGDASAFEALMARVPKHMRRDAAVAVLNDFFGLGAREGNNVGAGFATAYRKLSRSPTAMNALMKALPEEARQRFQDLGRIADGLYRAKRMENASGTTKALITALDDPKTLSKIYTAVGEVGAAEAATTSLGLPGVGSAAALARIVIKGKTKASEAADAFIRSDAMQEAIKAVARGQTPKANGILANSAEYAAWIRTMPQTDAQAIASLGVIGWLTAEQQKPQQEKPKPRPSPNGATTADRNP